MLSKKMLNNLKLGLYSLSLFNISINVESVYASDVENISVQNLDSAITIYDMDSGSFISYSTLLNNSDSFEKICIKVFSDCYQYDFSFLNCCRNLTRLEIYNLNGGIDLSFLDGMSNLSKLVIYEKVPFSNDNLSNIRKCENLEYLSINSPGYLDVLWLLELEKLNNLMLYNCVYENISMLSSCNGLKILQMKLDEGIPSNLFESMTFLKKLKLDVSTTCSVDYKKLIFLDELKFENPKSYTIAVDFTTGDFNTLTENNVKITALKNNVNLMSEVCLINAKLDDIVSSLNILSDDTDQEKLNKILIYVCNSLSYDDKIVGSKNSYFLGYKHYERGLLYTALEDSDNAICGNYAALVSALAKRVGLKCIYLQNKEHAWNLVKIDDVYYGLDATFIDCKYSNVANLFESGNYDLDWYLVPLDSLNDSFHISNKNPVLSSNKVLQKKILM